MTEPRLTTLEEELALSEQAQKDRTARSNHFQASLQEQFNPTPQTVDIRQFDQTPIELYNADGTPFKTTFNVSKFNNEKEGSLRVPVISADGQRGTIEVRDMPTALAAGYQLVDSNQVRDENIASERKAMAEGGQGKLAALEHGFVNWVGAGAPGAYLNYTTGKIDKKKPEPGSVTPPEDEKFIQEADDAHPWLYGLGAASGIAADTAVTMGAGSALKAAGVAARAAGESVPTAVKVAESLGNIGKVEEGVSTAAKLLGRTKQLAVEGALWSAPKALTEASFGDIDAAAQTLGLGVGGNVVFGHVLDALGGVASKGIEQLRGAADNATDKALGIKSGAGKWTGVWKEKDKAEFREWARTHGLTDAELGDALQSILDKGHGYKKAVEKADELINKFGSEIGAVVQKGDDAVRATGFQAYSPQKIAVELRELMEKQAEGMQSSEINNVKKAIASLESEVKKEGATLSTLQRLRQVADSKVDYTKEGTTIYKDIAGIFRDNLKSAVEKVGTQLNEPQLLQSFENANKGFEFSMFAKENFEKAAKQGSSNKFMGITDWILGASAPILGLKSLAAVAVKHLFEGKEGQALLSQLLTGKGNVGERLPNLVPFMYNHVANTQYTIAKGVYDALRTVPTRAVIGVSPLGSKGSESNWKKDAVAFEKLQNTPGLQDDVLHATTEAFSGGGAPQTAEAMKQQQLAAYGYLQSQLPKPGADRILAPNVKRQPSQREVAAYERKREIVMNPMKVIDHLRDGTLTHDHVEALNAVYPSIAKEIRRNVARLGVQAGLTLSSAKRRQVDILFSGQVSGPIDRPQNRSLGPSNGVSQTGPKVTQRAAESLRKSASTYQTETARISG